jgi:hypothetical protein
MRSILRFMVRALLFSFMFVESAAGAASADGPGWRQANSSGFGDPQSVEVTALEVFNGSLYAGIANPTSGARVFRWQTGATWEPVSQPGFGIFTDTRPLVIMDLAVFKNRLYASTGLNENAGQIWRSQDGTTWTPMVIAGFDDPDTVDITVLAEHDGNLYAGASNRNTGAQIWRSSSGDNNTWTLDGPSTPGTDPETVTGFATLGGSLYAAIETDGPVQVWRRDASGWTTVMNDGFSIPGQGSQATSSGGMTEFGGYLYVGAGSQANGAQLWRTQDGANWTRTITAGLGDPNNETIEAVFVFQNRLYVSMRNTQSGMEIWRSQDGIAWEQVNQDGFGDGNNSGGNRSNAASVFLGNLFVGTSNGVDGGEVWRMLEQGYRSYLPLLRR